jgi:hypothetical protein
MNKNGNTLNDIEVTPSDIYSRKYVPLFSVDVECTFSRYKSILIPNRRTSKFKNL